MPAHNSQRVLHIIPVLHDAADLGEVSEHVEAAAAETFDADAQRARRASIGQLWASVRAWAESLPDDLREYRLYQDGLPVSQHAAMIVRDLAAKGSENHRILRELISRGAALEGTEDPELLLAEYRFITESARSQNQPGNASHAEHHRRATQAAVLLRDRDAFIAKRINSTLRAGETGILFIGMLHDIDAHLDAGIEAHHPLDWSDPEHLRRA